MRFRSSYLFVLLFFSDAAGLGYEIKIWPICEWCRDPLVRDAAAISNGILTNNKK